MASLARSHSARTSAKTRIRGTTESSESAKMKRSESDPGFSDERGVSSGRDGANQCRAPLLSPATGTLILMKGREIAVPCAREKRATKRGGKGA
jgi:hypothetical protein